MVFNEEPSRIAPTPTRRSLLVGALLGVGCGTTIIAPQPGHEWCVEVQDPQGSESDPENFNIWITEPGNMDPSGCRCFSAEEDALLEAGSDAEKLGDPLPEGYEALRDQLVIAARERCIEIALNEFTPPLMYTDCLTVDVGLPFRLAETSDCTLCIKAHVWSEKREVVECPGSGGGSGGMTDMGASSESGGGDTADGTGTGRMVDCDTWDPGAAIASTVHVEDRAEIWVHHVHVGLLDALVAEQFMPALLCDDGRYVPLGDGTWAFEDIAIGDLLWELGIRNGHRNLSVRGYDFDNASGRTPWYAFTSVQDSMVAFDALFGQSGFEIVVTDATTTSSEERHILVDVLDCATPEGVACPTPE